MTVCQSTQLETCALCQDTADNNNDLNMMLHISPDISTTTTTTTTKRSKIQ